MAAMIRAAALAFAATAACGFQPSATPGDANGDGSGSGSAVTGPIDSTMSSLAVDRSTAVVGADLVTVTITVRDGSGDPLPGIAVLLAADGSGSAADNTISTPPPTDGSGVSHATWTSTRAGLESIAASASGVAFGDAQVTFTPGPAAGLAFASPPTEVVAGGPFTPAVAVGVVDEYGNAVPGVDGGDVTIALGANPGSAALEGSATAVIDSSSAAFPALAIGVSATGYTLVASAGGYMPATSAPFDVVPGDPAMMGSTVAATPRSQDADGTSTIALTAHIANAYGVPVPGVAVAFSSTGTNNTLSPMTAITDGDGNAIAALASTTAEVKAITAIAGTATLATTARFYPVGCSPQLPGPPWQLAAAANAYAVADVDGDGHLDVIAALPGAIAVYRGSATGAFGAPIESAIAGATHLAVADFDRDGKLDLALALPGAAAFAIARGDGAGHFGTPVAIGLASVPGALVAADFDGDGKPDVAALAANGTAVSAARGNGDGTFAAAAVVFTPASIGLYDLAAADLDGNGTLDLVISGATGVTGVLAGSDGSFAAPQTTAAGGATGLLAVADFGSDGAPDVAVAGASSIVVLLGNHDGTFQPPGSPIALAVPATGVLAADVDGDGIVDLVAGGAATGMILHGNGDGTFTALASYATGLPDGFAYADVDGDGKPDLVALEDGVVGAVRGTGSGAFAAPIYTADQPGVMYPTTADFNGDGKPDLVRYASGDGYGVLLAAAAGAVTAEPVASSTELAYAAVAGDVDGDVLASFGGTLGLARGSGDGTLGAIATQPSGGTAVESLALADLNGDGKLDLIFTDGAATGFSIALNIGGGAFAVPVAYGAGTHGAIRVADVTHDGVPDVVMADAGAVIVFAGDGHGAVATPVTYALGAAPLALAVGDVDGDGIADVVVATGDDVATLTLETLSGTAAGPLGATRTTPLAIVPGLARLELADLTGDGALDAALISSAGFAAVASGYGDGDFHLRGEYPIPYAVTAAGAPSVVLSDHDADGKIDISFWPGSGVGVALQTTCR